jgi:probable blue pigment (indigoidine) exporter
MIVTSRTRTIDILIAAIAPCVWGTTYFITTEFLPTGYPLTTAFLRGLPAGLLLLILVRQLPQGIWWWRVLLLGALNFSVFWTMLFISAYRLPGGVAATVGAAQPLIVVFLSSVLLRTPLRIGSVLFALLGLLGVALTVMTANIALDPIGIGAGLIGAVSMATGTVLTRRWQPPVSPLVFTAWQMTAGGLLLLPIAWAIEPPLPVLTFAHVAGFLYLGLIGGALTYMFWFRGLSRVEPNAIAPLGLLSPLTATLIGWIGLGQTLSLLQIIGMLLVLWSVWMSASRKAPTILEAG